MDISYNKTTAKNLKNHIFKERRTKSIRKSKITVLYLTDWLLFTLSFLLTYLAKKGNLNIDVQYFEIYPLIFLWWFFSLLISSKFRNFDQEKRRQTRLEPFFISFLYLVGMISIQILIFGQNNTSRVIIFGNLVFYLLFEIIFLSGIYFNPVKKINKKSDFSFLMFSFELLYIVGYLFFFPYYTHDIASNSELFRNILFAFALLWLLNSLLVHRFRLTFDRNFLKFTYPFLKSTFIYMSYVSFLTLLFSLSYLKGTVLLSIIIFSSFEFIFVSIFYLKKLFENGSEPAQEHYDILNSWGPKRIKGVIERDQHEKKKFFLKKGFQSVFIKEKLNHTYLSNEPKVFKFIDDNIGLDSIDILNAEIIDSANPYHTNIFPTSSLELLINLHKFNSYENINKYFINVHSKLKTDGIFISKFEPCERRKLHFLLNYPHALGNILYIFDFIWKRAFAKLPLFKHIYFYITKGRNRVYSMAEGLGRLYFCGFELVALKEIENFVYFIVKKTKDPLINLSPSTGLIFSQRRVGNNGKLINVFKMRTMHPYSEYIHKYALKKGTLSNKGKLQDDFRITYWGRIFRKYWIDELPMILNLIKGEMKLVGVRPLSETFYNIYPDDLKKKRIENKPGLVPPFYADIPTSIEEVFESERTYLEKYKKEKFKTDLSYFMRSFYNIIVKKAKSG